MNCRSAESLFSSYLEDEISQEERRALEAHLMGCRRCSLAMREVRATMSLLARVPHEVAVSAHFDEDVMARIRSGEGLSPSAAELIRELFSPARLRPVFLAGAGVCAVALAMFVMPIGKIWHPDQIRMTGANRAEETTPKPETGSVSVAPATQEVASHAQTSPGPALSPNRGTSVVASAPRIQPATRDSIVDAPIQPYSDEIINDVFYLERGRGSQDPTVVPVNQTQDDGVYIIF